MRELLVRAMRPVVGEKPWVGVLGLVHAVDIEGVGDVEVEERGSDDAGRALGVVDGRVAVDEVGVAEAAEADAGNVGMGEGFEMDAKGERGERHERHEKVVTVEMAVMDETVEMDVRIEMDAGDVGLEEDERVGECWKHEVLVTGETNVQD